MKWIPTTEKLPPIGVEVLATLRWDTVTIADRRNEYSWDIYEGEADVLNDDILAWMELPKPYKKEEKKLANTDTPYFDACMSDNYDYNRFCRRCGWNDEDYGCICPYGEEVYQCALYMFYHPKEVEQFNKDMDEWLRQKGDR